MKNRPKTAEDIYIEELNQWDSYHARKALGRLFALNKQEAVKWVKYLDESHKKYQSRIGKSTCFAKINFIVEFFNLTDEDLK